MNEQDKQGYVNKLIGKDPPKLHGMEQRVLDRMRVAQGELMRVQAALKQATEQLQILQEQRSGLMAQLQRLDGEMSGCATILLNEEEARRNEAAGPKKKG
jgi:SMC interacting uncharacterized protein involved in chromosome segregation